MATVYLAEDRVLLRKVALKSLHPHLLSHSDSIKRFKTEAVAIASLSHENIIRIFDSGIHGANHFLAMEYVDGVSLESMLGASPGGKLPNLVALAIFQQVLRGMAAAHENGILHRDIKPSNILVDRKGIVRIADFGIASLAEEDSQTRTGSWLGTPSFSSPEQAEGRAVTGKSDVFSAGILIYRCLCGKLPFQAATTHALLNAIISSQPPKLFQANRRTLPGFQELLEAMLDKDPARRPDANACVARVEDLADNLGFTMERSRIRHFEADPSGYAVAEDLEIAAHFRDHARTCGAGPTSRRATQLVSLADVFSAAAAVPEAAAMPFNRRRRFRALSLAGVGAIVTLISIGALRLNHPARTAAPVSVSQAPPVDAYTSTMPAPVLAGPVLSSTVPPSTVPLSSPRPARGSRVSATAQPVASTSVTGFLDVMTSPPFVKVTIDGRDMGITPLPKPLELKPGVHRMLLEREDCVPLHTTVNIFPAEQATLGFTLEEIRRAAE